MDHKEEYHDPDYASTSASVKEEAPSLSEDEKVEKIKSIIRREFNDELEVRENEIMLIDQRMSTSRRMLHRLRYMLVNNYYRDQKLQLTAGQVEDEVAAQLEPRARAEVATVLRDGQKAIHPSVRKLLGKKTVDLEEIFRSRSPRNKARKNYSAMVQSRNYTISADTTASLRPPQPEPSPQPEPPPQPEAGGSRPRKLPRHIEPKPENVCTLDEATRNKMKHRYRIIIGNTSKYAPPASRADRSTHKWLLYVRGVGGGAGTGRRRGGPRPQLSTLLTAVRVRLHHSYAPHHTVTLRTPPFHVCRRGWGEFPARVELHFALPERNPPAAVTHTVKLDRDYTGLQTLGAETIVDVWLYSSPEMRKYEFIEESVERPLSIQADPPTEQPAIKTEPTETIESTENTDWLDFFSKDTTELDVDEMIIKPKKEINDIAAMVDDNEHGYVSEKEFENTKEDWSIMNYKSLETATDIPNEILSQPTSLKKRIMKYIDPTTGKIYYLEIDRTLDLSKVQEIVINNTMTAKISPIKSNGLKNVRRKKGVSLLKPEVKNLLKNDSHKVDSVNSYAHIENDHCYLGAGWGKSEKYSETQASDATEPLLDDVIPKKEKCLYDCLCEDIVRLTDVRMAVGYLLKNIPLISDNARDQDYVKYFPFVVENDKKYWKLDFAKRRNIEWSRAKLINKMLTEHLNTTEQIWRTKLILIYARMHGFHAVRPEAAPAQQQNDEWSSWNDLENSRRIESNIKQIYPNASDISSLSVFNSEIYDNCLSESIEVMDSDEEIDIVKCELPVKVKKEVNLECDSSLTVLPVENEEDRLRFMFIERKCADIGIDLRNEDVGNGYSYSAVHAVLATAMRSFAEEMVRSALAAARSAERPAAPPPVWSGCGGATSLGLEHVWRGVATARLRVVATRGLAASRQRAHPI
ncbi:LOW QUALITY PROTEIN: YEATS domain containing 2 homolog D12 [Aphomia sociella]